MCQLARAEKLILARAKHVFPEKREATSLDIWTGILELADRPPGKVPKKTLRVHPRGIFAHALLVYTFMIALFLQH